MTKHVSGSTFVESLKYAFSKIPNRAEKEFDTSGIEEKISELEKKMIPDVGTYIYCTYDPNEKWPGTSWDKIEQGTFLISAGDQYNAGESYGENFHKLTENELPEHSHKGLIIDELELNIDNITGNLPTDHGIKINSEIGQKYSSNIITGSTGENVAHNNIPLSIAVPLWCRVS